jgi:hypothetical protein
VRGRGWWDGAVKVFLGTEAEVRASVANKIARCHATYHTDTPCECTSLQTRRQNKVLKTVINIHVVKLDCRFCGGRSGWLDLNDPFYANREVCDTDLEMLDVKAPVE